MTVTEILSRSSNVGAVMLALNLGKERLGWWIERFGFGHHVGIDFPGESAGIVAPAQAMDRLDDRQRPDRPGHRGHASADGVRVRGDRERGRLDSATLHRAGRRRGPAEARPASRHRRSTARQLIDMMRDVVAGRHRHRGRGAPATRWPARPEQPRSRMRPAATPIRTTSRRSSGSSRPRCRVSRSSSPSTSRRGTSRAARSPRRRSRQIAEFALPVPRRPARRRERRLSLTRPDSSRRRRVLAARRGRSRATR